MDTYHGRFLYLKFLLATVGAAFLVCGAYKIAGQDTRTVTVTKPAPGLTASSTAADASSRFSGEPQTVPGEELGFPEGSVCDAYPLKDGVALVCHG
jgi:hypothetical protein